MIHPRPFLNGLSSALYYGNRLSAFVGRVFDGVQSKKPGAEKAPGHGITGPGPRNIEHSILLKRNLHRSPTIRHLNRLMRIRLYFQLFIGDEFSSSSSSFILPPLFVCSSSCQIECGPSPQTIVGDGGRATRAATHAQCARCLLDERWWSVNARALRTHDAQVALGARLHPATAQSRDRQVHCQLDRVRDAFFHRSLSLVLIF